MKISLTTLAFLFSSTLLASTEFSLTPLFTYGNYQRFDEVVNLTQAPRNTVVLSPESHAGYEVQATRKIYASLGVQAVSSVELADGSFGYVGLGLYPSYNSYANQFKKFSNSTELREFKFNVPTAAEDLVNLKIGEAVYWNSQGGLTLHLSVGAHVFSLGPKVSVEGGHSVYVEKKSQDEVYLEIRRLSTKSWGIVAGAMIAYAEAGELLEASKGLSFLINVSTPQGKTLYDDLIQRGRADRVQESPEAQAHIGDVRSLKALGSMKAVVGVPFIPIIEFKKESGDQVLTEDRSDVWGKNTHSVRALSYKLRTSRFFKAQTLLETGALAVDESDKGKKTLRTQLHWFRKGNRFKIERLKLALKKIQKQTGMSEELAITFAAGNDSIKFAKIELIVNIGASLQDAVIRAEGLSGPKARAEAFQKFWSGPESFQRLLGLIKKCGGSFGLEVSGEMIERIQKQESFPESPTCEL